MLAYLLISASSAAATRVDDWQSNWGKDEFTEMASASVAMSFLAFIAFALSSIISGYNLFNHDSWGHVNATPAVHHFFFFKKCKKELRGSNPEFSCCMECSFLGYVYFFSQKFKNNIRVFILWWIWDQFTILTVILHSFGGDQLIRSE